MSDLRVAIISIYPFPIGMAATNRMTAYSKGLIANGAEVDIYIPAPTHRPSTTESLPNSGQFEQINYYYPFGRYTAKHKVCRAISVLSGYRKLGGFHLTSQAIKQAHQQKAYDVMIISNDALSYLSMFSKLAKELKIKSVFIFDEYPIPIRHKLKDKIPLWKTFLYKKLLVNIDAYISISEKLAAYYNNLVPHETHIMTVITDTSRFDDPNIIQTKEDYVCYMGNMELSKDNVDNIIRAFAMISSRHPSLELHLYGTPSAVTKNTLSKLIQELNLTNQVFLKGRVSSELVPSVLLQAKVLVSSQPDTVRASGGFPTKLGEYLSTGVPTLLTNVGENAKYVTDNQHVFFVEPGNIDMYAKRLDYILNNYEEACQIGKNGKQLIIDNYSHLSVGKKMKEFLKVLILQ